MGKQVYNVKGHQFERQMSTHRKVRSKMHGHTYFHRETASVTTVVFRGDFRIEIDVDEIIRRSVNRAARNTSGKSKLLDGLIVAKVFNHAEESRSTRELPLSEGYEVVP